MYPKKGLCNVKDVYLMVLSSDQERTSYLRNFRETLYLQSKYYNNFLLARTSGYVKSMEDMKRKKSHFLGMQCLVHLYNILDNTL